MINFNCSLLDNEEIKVLYVSAKKIIEQDGIWLIIGMNETTAYELYSNVNLFVDKSEIMLNSLIVNSNYKGCSFEQRAAFEARIACIKELKKINEIERG